MYCIYIILIEKTKHKTTEAAKINILFCTCLTSVRSVRLELFNIKVHNPHRM